MLLGMDTAAARRHANRLRLADERLRSCTAAPLTAVQNTEHWHGPDADHFRSRAESVLVGQIRALGNELSRMAFDLAGHVAEQEAASEKESAAIPGPSPSEPGGRTRAAEGGFETPSILHALVGSLPALSPHDPKAPIPLMNSLSGPWADDGLEVPDAQKWDPYPLGPKPPGMSDEEFENRGTQAREMSRGEDFYLLTQEDADQILHHYQVAEDEGTEWELSGFNRLLADIWKVPVPGPAYMTVTEAEMLDRLSPFGAIDFQKDMNTATSAAEQRFGNDLGHDGTSQTVHNHNDAFRHAYVNAMHTSSMGEIWTTDYWTAHEAKPGNLAAEEAMDLHNNEVGRRIAGQNPGASDAELADLVETAVRRGEMVVIDESGRLVPSNAISMEEAGYPEKTTLPGHERS